MLEAHIVSPNGSLYFASKQTPEDLEGLRAHVRNFAVNNPNVSLDLHVNDAEWADLLASGWLDRLARAGALVRHRMGAHGHPNRLDGASCAGRSSTLIA